MYGGEGIVDVARPEPVEGGKNVVIGTRTWLGPEWTHVDISPARLHDPETGNNYPVDVVSDAKKISLLEDGCADLVYSQECLEHFPWGEYQDVLKEWVRLVKPGGRIVVEVPDFLAACKQVLATDTLEMDRAIQQIIFGGQVNEYDFHFVGLTPRTLTDDLEQLGMDVEKVERGWEVGYLRATARKP